MTLSFYLDSDVDVGCAAVLRAAGYAGWTARDAATRADDDDEQTVYATDKGAVLIAHDRVHEPSQELPIGRHIRLVCHQLDGPDLLAASIDRLVSFLAASPDMVLEVRPGRHGVHELKAWFGTGRNRPTS